MPTAQEAAAAGDYLGRKFRAVRTAMGPTAEINPRPSGQRRLRRRRRPAPRTLGRDVYSQQAFTSATKGERLPERQLVDRSVKATIERTVYQFRRYANDGTNVNNFVTDIGQIATDTRRDLPVYIIDLSRIVQTVSPSPFAPSSAMRRMYMDVTGGDDGKVKWRDIDGIGPDGSTLSPNWFVSEDKALSVRQKPIYKSLMTWASIKLNLMGSRARPGYYKVQIINLDEEDLVDPWLSSTNEQITFWQDYVAKLTCNTIHDLPKFQKRKMKVLMEKTLAWNPTSTTENDPRAHVDTVNLFYRPNKTFIYQTANEQTNLNDDAKIAVTNDRSTNRGLGISDTPIKGKIYLLISAFCPYVGETFNNAIHPSFEWNIKTSHICLDT
jgi:hypothetical protein